MSTSAIIICQSEAGTLANWVQWDGYPDRLGRILNTHFNEQKKAEALCRLQHIQCFEPDDTAICYQDAPPLVGLSIEQIFERWQFASYVYVYDVHYGWSCFKPNDLKTPIGIPRNGARYYAKNRQIEFTSSLALEDWLTDLDVETLDKSYYGKTGCMCGCNGTYSDSKSVAKRRINDVKRILKNGCITEISNMPCGLFFTTEYNKVYAFYFKEDRHVWNHKEA